VQSSTIKATAIADPSGKTFSKGDKSMLWNIIVWIVLGGIAGWIASIIMGRNASMGLVANIIVGILGAIIGGFIMNLVGGTGTTGFNLYSLFVAVLGAVILLFIVGLFSRRS
jgi:uncharacterized membrane protein YeaQ/YmgE (transglycosylase-associated protein family)